MAPYPNGMAESPFFSSASRFFVFSVLSASDNFVFACVLASEEEATDVERVMEFHDCQFVANVLGSTPAVAIDVATLTVGRIILTGDTCAFNCTKIATATGVISGLNVKVATATIGIQTT